MKNKLLVACMIMVLLATTNRGYCVNYTAPGYEAVIGDYIESYMRSDFKKLDHILSDEACVKIPRAEKVIVQDRASLIESMRNDKGTTQQCTNKYEIITSTDALVIARVDFQYQEFKQQNYIILEKNDNKEWKITQVCKVFGSNAPQTSGPANVSAKAN